MSSFDDRERRFEAEFSNNAELRFRVEARRDKLVGLWAAERLGLSGTEAETYAKAVVKADLEEPGDDDVFRKLRSDLPASVEDETIRGEMARCLQEAMESVRKT